MECRKNIYLLKDIVDGSYLASNADIHNWNQIWNVGNEANEKTIKYMAEKIKELTNSNSKNCLQILENFMATCLQKHLKKF